MCAGTAICYTRWWSSVLDERSQEEAVARLERLFAQVRPCLHALIFTWLARIVGCKAMQPGGGSGNTGAPVCTREHSHVIF
jgi:hypothetical protein